MTPRSRQPKNAATHSGLFPAQNRTRSFRDASGFQLTCVLKSGCPNSFARPPNCSQPHPVGERCLRPSRAEIVDKT
jgi:hypothetical protein